MVVFMKWRVLVGRWEHVRSVPAEGETMTAFRPTYSISRSWAGHLHWLAESASEGAAIDRLEDGRGRAEDVLVAAELYRRVGEDANAAEVLRMLEKADCAELGMAPL